MLAHHRRTARECVGAPPDGATHVGASKIVRAHRIAPPQPPERELAGREPLDDGGPPPGALRNLPCAFSQERQSVAQAKAAPRKEPARVALSAPRLAH